MIPRLLRFCLMLCLLIHQPALAAVVFGVVPAEQSGLGLEVGRVVEQTPAHKAGLRTGDVLLRVQGVHITDADTLKRALAPYRAGSVVRVQYLRGGKAATALVELAARPQRVATQTSTVTHDLAPELQLQFVQAKSRLLIQLCHLPHGMDAAQVKADLKELRVLAGSIPSDHEGWLQGSSVETSLEFKTNSGLVILRAENDSLFLETENNGKRLLFPIDTEQQRNLLPEQVLQCLQKL